MNTSPAYKITFIAGELKDRSFVIAPEGTRIGSSRDADIRLASDDIAPEHLTILPLNDMTGVQLHFEATAAKNCINGEPAGQDAVIAPGADVRLGQQQAFILEATYATTLHDSPNADDTEDATQDDTDDDEDENSGALTRFASENELQELRNFSKRQKHHHRMTLLIGVILAIGIIAAAYFANGREENPATWPGEVDDAFDDGECRFEINTMGKCMVYFPKTPYTKVSHDDNSCDVFSALGRDMDIPFHISFTIQTLPDGFKTTRKNSFAAWQSKALEERKFHFQNNSEQLFYSPVANGFPYTRQLYIREAGNMQWQGYVSYMRYLDKELVLLREVPIQHFTRAKNVLTEYNAFVVSPTMEKSFWDIPETPMPEDDVTLVKRTIWELSKNADTMQWRDTDLRIRTLLVRAYEMHNDNAVKLTNIYLQLFRQQQRQWYANACVAYQYYEITQDREKQIALVSKGLRIFSDDNDRRRSNILKSNWTLDF